MSLNNWADLQLSVMKVLWKREGATVHEVIEELSGEKVPAYTTILTTLSSLEKQGLVAHETVQGTRTFQYRALITQSEIQLELIEEVTTRLFEGSSATLIKTLLQADALKPHELEDVAQEICRRQAHITRP